MCSSKSRKLKLEGTTVEIESMISSNILSTQSIMKQI